MRYRGALSFGLGVAAALALGWGVFPHLLYGRAEQPLQFDHKVHTSEAVGLRCEHCHGLRTDGSFAGIPGVAKCAECHASAMGDTAAEKRLVDEYVTPGREIPWLVYARQPDNAHFPHAQHLRQGGMKCEECHGGHGESQQLRPRETNRITGYSRDLSGASLAGSHPPAPRGMKMSDCMSCHAERKSHAMACVDCHK